MAGTEKKASQCTVATDTTGLYLVAIKKVGSLYYDRIIAATNFLAALTARILDLEGSNTKVKILNATSSKTDTIASNTLLQSITIICTGESETVLKLGTTSGGTEIMDQTTFAEGGEFVVPLNRYRAIGYTLHITLVSGSASFIILKQLNHA